MAYAASIGLGIPQYEISQKHVKELVKGLFPYSDKEMDRLLPVFDNAAIKHRQLVVDVDWFKKDHTFKERNDLYFKYAKQYSLEAIDNCLNNKDFLKQSMPYEAVDLIVFVSSTGIATPSLDVYLMNSRPFRNDISRMPLWGLGCAGGAIGLSRVFDWLSANPEKTALLVCCELCSLTFQKDDIKKSNLIGTALFGDGSSAALIIGENSPYLSDIKGTVPKILKTSSYTEKNSISVMGWKVMDKGFEVIFSKEIPSLVKTVWKKHLTAFKSQNHLSEDAIHSYILHPGGKKVLEAMSESFSISNEKVRHSHNVLKNHGNMSSVTVLYVLNEWMKDHIPQKSVSILSALGPGFSSELLLLEWTG